MQQLQVKAMHLSFINRATKEDLDSTGRCAALQEPVRLGCSSLETCCRQL